MKIIKANIDHLEDVIPLFDEYRQFYRQASDLDGARKFILNRLKNKDSVIFLAYESSVALGFTQLYFLFSSVSMEPMLLLNDLYVSKSNRDKQIGTALIEKAKEYCKATANKGLVLQTEKTNRAQELYKRMGFIEETDLYMFWKAN